MISHYFSHAQIISWAWRLPFIIGALLAVIIYLMRRNLPDELTILRGDPHQVVYSSSGLLIKELFKNHLKNLLIGILITLFFSYLITTSLYLPIYLKQQFGFTTNAFFSVMTIGILLSAITAPIFGYLGDRYNRAKLSQIIPISFLLFLFCSLQLMKSKTYASLAFFIFGYEIFISLFSTNCLPLLAELFPKNVRATGIGLCYNLSFSLAAFCPMVLSQSITASSHILVISAISGFISIITVSASLYLAAVQLNVEKIL